MNFRQLFASSTHEERAEALALILENIETQNIIYVFVNGRLIRDRRGYFRGAHFLHDRRRALRISHPSPRLAGMLLIAASLNLGVWMFALPYNPQLATPIVTAHLIGLGLLFAFHPMPRKALAVSVETH